MSLKTLIHEEMKKIFTIVLGIALLLTVGISCSKKQFADNYHDPSKNASVSCENLFTGVMYAGRQYMYVSYWRFITWERFMGRFSQTIGYNNSGGIYEVTPSYAGDRWNNFYMALAQFRLLQSTYEAEENGEEKVQNKIYVDLAEVFILDQLTQMVDVFGPAPYSKAGFLPVSGKIDDAYPAYDSDVAIYKNALERLDALYTEVDAFKGNITDFTQSSLTAHDFLNNGNLDKWLIYINSLMLRLGVHVSAQGDLTSQGHAAVAKASTRPLVTNLNEAIMAKMIHDGGSLDYSDDVHNSFGDEWNPTGNWSMRFASQYMIDAMQVTGTDDPRLIVMYNKNNSGKYRGKHRGELVIDQQANENKLWNERVYSHLDSVTFTGNDYMDSPVISAAEVYFLLAEAYNQGYGVSQSEANAKANFKKGLEYSIRQYYKQNMTSVVGHGATGYKATAVPSDAKINTYTEAVWNHYPNKLEAIMTMKWTHFGIMQANQAFTDIRRTGYPTLTWPEDNTASVYKNVIQRVVYPQQEVNNNNENYKAAAAMTDNDSPYKVLFWAKKIGN